MGTMKALLAAVGLWGALAADEAQALSIRLVDLLGGDGTVTIADNGALDLDSTDGSITLVRLGFGGFTTSTSIASAMTGATDELFGQFAAMSRQASGGVGVRLLVSETGFDAQSGAHPFSFSLTSNPGASAEVSVTTFVDDSNALFGTATEVGSVTSSDGASDSDFGDGFLALSGLYSVTHVIDVTHDAAAMSNGDARYVSAIPTPAALPLLLGGLGGLAAIRRRRA